MWNYTDNQIRIAKQGLAVLREHAMVYLAMEERTGKTGTAIKMVEDSNAKSCLVLTKKKALDGWLEHFEKLNITKKYKVTNYHQARTVKGSYDIVILDESHSYLSKYPKVGAIWLAVSKLTKDKPIIYMSATPSAQSYSLLFNQFKLCTWSPWWQYRNFYDWHKVYGIPQIIYLGGRQVRSYAKTRQAKVEEDIKPLIIDYTRTQLGFRHEPEDVVHYVELDSSTKAIYRDLDRDQIATLQGTDIVADNIMSLRTKLHQLEGGTLKHENGTLIVGNTEKISFILDKFGDTEDLVIMYNYIAEEKLLKKHFKHAVILQATSYAEGVDLSDYEHLVVYSMNFSTAQYTQRRARQANMYRDSPIKVHFLLVKKAISDQVYQTVAINKKNYVDKYFERGAL